MSPSRWASLIPKAHVCHSALLGAIIHRLFGMILVAPGAVARVFQMLARLGDVIYSFGCIVAGVILALGVFDYWFGQQRAVVC